MKAHVLGEPGGGLHLEELKEPRPQAGEVLVRVAGIGVCHTDLHVMKGEVAFPTPGVLGHEISGTVLEVGEGVTNAQRGDRVVSAFIMPCGTCRHCVKGHDDICEKFFAYNRLKGVLYDGTSRLERESGEPIAMYSMGGLAERCVVPATDVFRLPEGMKLSDSAVLGCSLFTSVGAVRNVGEVRPGDAVAIVAVGGIGLNLVQTAAAFGATTVIAIDVVPEKLELAREMGATHVFDAADPECVAKVRAVTGGRGVDVAFEALGNPRTVDTAIRIADDGGRVVLVGIAPQGVTAEFDITHVVRRKIQIRGSFGARTRTDMPLVLDLVASGRLSIDKLITDRFPFEQANEAYRRLAAGQIVGRAVIETATASE